MRFRTTFLLFLLVLAGAALVAYVDRHTPSTDEVARRARFTIDLQADRVESLRIQTTNYLVACRRQGDLWVLTEPVTARADPATLDRLLSALEDWPRHETLRASDLRKRNLTRADYGLEMPRAEITWVDPAGTHSIRVGRTAPMGHALYVQHNGEEDVLVASTNAWTALPASADDFRSRSIFDGTPLRAVRVELKRPEGFLRLARSHEGAWTLQQPDRGPADPSFVLDLLELLYASRVQGFVAEQAGGKEQYGLDTPRAEIAVSAADDVLPQVLFLGEDVPAGTNLVFAGLGDPGPIVTVERALLDAALLDANVLRTRRLLDWSPDTVGFVEIRAAEEVLALERSPETGEWSVVRPIRRKARASLVSDLVDAWCSAAIREFVADDVTNFNPYALSPPVFRITFATAPPPNPSPTPAEPDDPEALALAEPSTSPVPRSVSLGLGRVEAERERLLVRREDQASVFEVDLAMLQRLSVSPTFYFDPEVLHLDADTVRSLTLERDGRRQTVDRSTAGAFGPSAENDADGAVLLPARVAEVLDALQSLRAVQFVPASPQGLEPLGLANPSATLTIRFREETGISQSILFGRPHEGVGRYTMIRGQEVVFVLPNDTCERLLADLCGPAASSPETPAPRAAPP